MASDLLYQLYATHTPAPVVVATLALLRAPSPLVVYAATVTEQVVSGSRPAIKASCSAQRHGEEKRRRKRNGDKDEERMEKTDERATKFKLRQQLQFNWQKIQCTEQLKHTTHASASHFHHSRYSDISTPPEHQPVHNTPVYHHCTSAPSATKGFWKRRFFRDCSPFHYLFFFYFYSSLTGNCTDAVYGR